MKFLDHSEPAHRPLQPLLLRAHDIKTAALIYPLSKEKVEYIDTEFETSKNKL